MTTERAATVLLPPSLALLARARAVRLDEAVADVLHRAVVAFAALTPSDRARYIHEYQWGGASPEAWCYLKARSDTLSLVVLCTASAWKAEEVVVAALAKYLSAP